MKTLPRIPALGLLACLAAGPVWACPTPGDLKTGIIFQTKDGNVEQHKETAPNWVQIIATFSDGTGSVLEADRGIYMYSSIPLENGRPNLPDRLIFAKPNVLKAWPDPVPQARWENPGKGAGKAKSGRSKTTRVGDCTFNSFDVTIDFNDDDYSETYSYLTDFGTALLIKTRAGDSTERYTYVSAKAQAR